MHRTDQQKIENIMHGEPGTTREFIVTRLNRELSLGFGPAWNSFEPLSEKQMQRYGVWQRVQTPGSKEILNDHRIESVPYSAQDLKAFHKIVGNGKRGRGRGE